MLALNDPSAAESAVSAAGAGSLLAAGAGSLMPSAGDPVWKVLVYDRLGQEIISPLLHVGDLRERGITVHMSIYGDRQPIPDAPAIYFVEPTEDNIRRIADDLSRQLYDSFYINFSSALPRGLLEDLASSAVASDSFGLVAQIYDQHLNYVSLESNLFSLQMNKTYLTVNNPSTTESQIEDTTSQIVSSLFSILVTLGTVPIIRCPRGTSAEAVAIKLESKLRDHLLNTRANLFNDGIQVSRPVLVILDRSMDPGSLLSHTWTYATLVHDILDMKLNRLNVTVDERGRPVKKTYDMDVSDYFWTKNAGNPFPQVAGDVDAEINKYKQEVEQVTRSCGVGSLEEVDPNDFSSSAKTLSSAMKQLPELTARKKTLDMHMNIATALFKVIQERQLDAFFTMEESIGKLNKSSLLEAIRDDKKSPEDKMRLFIIYYLSVDDISKEDLAEYEAALSHAGCNTAPISHVKQVRMFSKMTAAINQPAPAQPASNDLFGTFTSNLSKLTDTLQSTGVSGRFESLVAGVKNLLPTRKELAVTRTVDAIMEGTPGGPADDYLYLDPKAARSGAASRQPPKGRVTFQEAIVFVVGGGNYLEYHNLVDYAQRSNLVKKKIMYGSTELLTANAFMQQLEALGQK
ncbi:Sec1-like protein [Entophlyctis helioformis]|nr:Sec1-like protein [Entophlyctis helioformis]